MRRQELGETCQVCFVKPHRLFEYSQIIYCVKCGSACHRSCYNPSLKESRFKCDGCLFLQNKNEVCFICGNQGLLKKVSDQFAHPVCLLFSPKTIVLEYSTLTFSLIGAQTRNKHQKKSVCSICKKSGHLEKCYAQCSNEVHMYCAWRSYQEQNGWNHNTIVEKLQYSVYFEKKSKVYLQPVGQTLIALMGSFSLTSKCKLRQFELACPKHTDTIFECCTQEKYFYQSQINYIQCDQCFRWYHKDCLDKKLSVQKNQIFICSCCENFWKMIRESSQNEFCLKRFPRMNVCQLIYLQCLLEKKRYQLTKSQQKLLFSMPIQPSLIFIQSLIKRNILTRLKVQHFNTLCRLNFSQRIDKKLFKDKFKKKFQPILTLITQTKSLYEMVDQNEKNEEMESQKSLKQEERENLMKWINLLNRFKQGNKVFNEVISNLVKKLNKWLRSLSKQQQDNSLKSFQSQSIEQSNNLASSSIKLQSGQTNEVKVQEMSSQQESQRDQTQSQSLSNKHQSSMPLLRRSGFKKNHKKEEEEMEDDVYCDEELEGKIITSIKMIRKSLNNKKINKEKLTLQILNQHNDKVFFLQTVLNQKLPLQSVLKVFLLESALKNILNLIQQYKITQNLLNNQDPHEAQTTFSGDINDKSTMVLKNKNKTETKIAFIQRFRDKIFEIYFNCQSQIKKKFKKRIQYLYKTLDGFIEVLQLQKIKNPPKKLTFDEAFEQFVYNPKAEGFSSGLKAQIKSSFDENELKFFRLQIEKKKIYAQIKKIELTLTSSSHIGRQYENYCKSSSDTSNENIAEEPKSLREQILGFQKKALEQWIKIFGITLNLANSLISLKNNDISTKALQESKASLIDKQPLLTIEDFLSIDYKEKEDLQQSVFKLLLIFFCKLRESLINYKVFNPKFVSIVDQMGRFCIDFSLRNVILWTDDEVSLSTMRYLYKIHYKLFNDSQSQQKQRFKEIWSLFETDEHYSSYLQQRKHLLFRDPSVTEQIFKKKIPQMLVFYQQTELICRVKQLRRMRIWICYYLKCLELIGAVYLVEEQFLIESIKQRYERVGMLSFNQLAIMISELHKVKFPQGVFASRIIDIFNKAVVVENEIQSFFDKSIICLDESYALKGEFQNMYNIDKDCFLEKDKIDEEKGSKISSSEYKILMGMIEENEVSNIITFELEKYAILDQRNTFKRWALKAEEIIKTKNQLIPIRQLNLIYFQIRSYPFHYANLHVFLLFIAKKVQKQKIFGNLAAKMKQKQKENASIFEKALGDILSQLEPSSKMMCRTLTRQQLTKKLQQITSQQAYKQVQKIPSIQRVRKLINQKLQKFDKIKSSLFYLTQKVKLNKTLEHEEIEMMDDYISAYKKQKIYEFGFEILSNNVEQYKLAFSAIPDDPVQKIMALEQLKSLKKPFKTKEYLKRIHQLEKKIEKY